MCVDSNKDRSILDGISSLKEERHIRNNLFFLQPYSLNSGRYMLSFKVI